MHWHWGTLGERLKFTEPTFEVPRTLGQRMKYRRTRYSYKNENNHIGRIGFDIIRPDPEDWEIESSPVAGCQIGLVPLSELTETPIWPRIFFRGRAVFPRL